MRARVILILMLLSANRLLGAEITPPNRIIAIHAPDGITLQAYEWGNPAGRPIIFLHGIFQSALSWHKQTSDPGLAAKYRLVALDLRGHGASDKPAGGEYYRDDKRWADDITALLDTLDLRKPLVVGWSYGGRALNDYLAANGDGRLGGIVYVAARGTNPSNPEPAGERRVHALHAAVSPDPLGFIAGSREFIEHCFGRPADPKELDLLSAASMQTPLYVRLQLTGRPLHYDATLAAIRVPTLIIQGDKDAEVSPAIGLATQKLIPQAKLSIFEGDGHSTFLEDSARFNAEIDAFAASLP